MTTELIEKFVQSKENKDKTVTIFFKQRNAINGLFVKGRDYEEMKVKNFWRIVSEANLAAWQQSKDASLTRLFSGGDFTKLK